VGGTWPVHRTNLCWEKGGHRKGVSVARQLEKGSLRPLWREHGEVKETGAVSLVGTWRSVDRGYTKYSLLKGALEEGRILRLRGEFYFKADSSGGVGTPDGAESGQEQ